MAFVVKDRVRQTTTTTGTGTVTLNGSVTGFQGFSVIGDGNDTYYCIVDPTAGAWEVGIGTYTASGTTLSRTTVLESSNSNNLVSFGSGVKDVFCTYPADRAIYTNAAGTIITPATASVLGVVSGGTGAATLTGYVKGNGTSAMTASSTIPNTDISGLGTMSTQNANAVAITGGSINGTTIGGSSATTATVTVLTATSDSSFTSTGALLISKGTTGQQPGSPVTGMLRYNTTTSQFEGYSGSSPAWNPVGGASLSNDTSTSSNVYPTFANATSGSATTLYTSNAKLLYKPSTGEFQSSALVASNGIFLNNATVSSSYTIASGTNGFSVGPITIASGQTVTVASGQRWIVI